MNKFAVIAWSAVCILGLGSSAVEAAKPVDNDGDGYSSNRDCDDGDASVWELNSCGECAPEPPGGCGTCTVTEDPEASCSDGLDNDCDTLVDGDDPDCATGSACADYQDKGTCNADAACEWQGNPNTGSCEDAACTVTENPEVSCSDGVDNDCDGATDSGDSDCAVSSNRDVIVMATNDLGMHCACPGAEKMLLLPPFNTLRAQVIERGGQSPVVLSDPTDIRVEYDILENYDDFNPYKADDPSKTDLSTDLYFSAWMDMMPKYGFGSARNAQGAIQGLTGAMLAGEMDAQPEGWWEVVGVPAFPDAHNSSNQEKIMVDPLGGPDRNPYLTAEVKVYEQSSGALLASTSATVPVSFGGCCSCHLQLTADNGMDPNPDNSFALMGQLHERDSGINFALLDPDGDGETGPVRCSVCHWDPAMGESSPLGYSGLPVSQYSFSDVLHRWHVESSAVLSYNPDLATDCYECHPSNEVMCYRGHHTGKTIGQDNHEVWCTDCHGDLNQRVAEGQLANPWSEATLPMCQDCHSATGENGNLHHVFGGSFLKSMSHKNDAILCSTCHGAPHALNPSTLAKDNVQNLALQGLASPIGKCSTCHTNKKDSYSKPGH
ncbi:MAG: hypothetical protein PVI91_13355 [Gammaproteobacteria bacterium]|jgi:hypothetical protein